MKFKTQFDIFKWYKDLRETDQPIAWCSAFVPAEVLMAAGIMPVYPENHSAMLGALSPTRDMEHPYANDAIDRSVEYGLKAPKLCSYALSDIGVLLKEEGSPIGGLPPADLFYSCNSQCSVVERWGNEVQDIFSAKSISIPHYLLKAPSLVKKETHTESDIKDFREQLEAHIKEICIKFKTQFSEEKLREIVIESNKANRYWQMCLELAKESPSPWSMLDAFTAMAPIVIARGTELCTQYYKDLYSELKEIAASKQSGDDSQTIRLLWDAIPIWPRKNWFKNYLAEQNATFVVSTYTHSWWFQLDENNLIDGISRRYAWNTMNRSRKWMLDWTLELVKEFKADGIISHFNQSCGIWNSYVKSRMPGYERADIPNLTIRADMVDARMFDEDTVKKQLDEYINTLRISKKSA